MKVYLNSVSGIDDAIVAMYMSKRHWNRDLEYSIREICRLEFSSNGRLLLEPADALNEWMGHLTKIGCRHPTLLRFIDLSVTVDGLHRAGQDDWDSHARRFDNRIIRESTRLSEYKDEKSDYYSDKILTLDEVVKLLDVDLPDNIVTPDGLFVRATNGYIREDLRRVQDVTRGLYMLSIPSRFIFKCNLAEFAHVYDERGLHGSAHEEVKECCEEIVTQLQEFVPWFTRDFLLKVSE